jgi:heme exporter protein CcmD
MVKDVMPFVAGSYGAAVLMLGFLSATTFMRYQRVRARLRAIDPRRQRRPSLS